MISRLIAWSARNLLLVIVGSGVCRCCWCLRIADAAARRHSGSLGRAGDRLHRIRGQAPQVVEDQVTYPLTTAMLTVPKSKVVRGFSFFFGVSFVYVIFEDGTDPYWARSRCLNS